MRKILLFCFVLFVTGCAGYRYLEKNNPFSIYGIKSIYVPTFYNHTNLSNASHTFTKEFNFLLGQFTGLKLKDDNKSADATLIGILTSPKKLSDSVSSSGLRGAKSVASNSIGNDRGDFYVPSANQISLSLRIIVLKNPTKEEIELIKTQLGEHIPLSSKIIFNESIALSSSFNREYFDSDAGKVHATLNRGALRTTVENMALQASENFRNMIIYAF